MRFSQSALLLAAAVCLLSQQRGVDGLVEPKPSRAFKAVAQRVRLGNRFQRKHAVGMNAANHNSKTDSHQDVGDAAAGQQRSIFQKMFSDRQKLFQASTSGLAVSLAMIPEAVAFAFVAGVNPLVGLWTTVVLGFVAAALGGRAGICSSASGACSIVVAALCAAHGPAYLSACAIMAGMLQIGAGLLGLGSFIKLVPQSVMYGFVNGLAVVMTKAQMMHFKTGGKFMSLTSDMGSSTYGVAALTMVLVKLIPRLTKAVPPSLGAVAIVTAIAHYFKLSAKTLADVAGASTFAGGWSVLPKLGLPMVPMSMETVGIVLPYAITMAAVGCLESLLTMQLLDSIVDDGKKGSAAKECVGQGSGNILSGLTGGIGGCALLGQSIINVQSGGGISRWSGMSMALFLAIGIVAAAPLLASVPVASLVGVMLLVCQSTFSWSSLRLLNKIPKLDAAVIALVSILMIQKDLAVAVLSGTVVSALGFAWKQSSKLKASKSSSTPKSKTYKMDGPLFFGSTSQFDSLFSVKSDPAQIVLDFTDSQIMDHSAANAIQSMASKYKEAGKQVFLQGLSDESADIMMKHYYGGSTTASFEMVGTIPADHGPSRNPLPN